MLPVDGLGGGVLGAGMCLIPPPPPKIEDEVVALSLVVIVE
jgi:hypothetical protein